jgi:hypothetical protein
MQDEKQNIGEPSPPRYEFRTFGRDFSQTHELMKSLSGPVPEFARKRLTSEIYVLSHTTDLVNCKIRDDKIDIKELIKVEDNLEQWEPVLKMDFPLFKKTIIKQVFRPLWARAPLIEKEDHSLEKFLQVVKNHRGLQLVYVDKERYGFLISKTICEFARVFINGAMVQTVSSESTNKNDVLKTIRKLKMDDHENINYIRAIKRVLGWEERPLK